MKQSTREALIGKINADHPRPRSVVSSVCKCRQAVWTGDHIAQVTMDLAAPFLRADALRDHATVLATTLTGKDAAKYLRRAAVDEERKAVAE